MRIAWYSNAPWGPTGYGQQTAMIAPRLQADGHDVSVLANWGQQVAMGEWQGMPVYPQGLEPYSLDVVDDQADHVLDGGGGWVVTLYDVWVLTGRPLWDKHAVASWVPVDHYPVPPKVVEWCKGERRSAPPRVIAMSQFGQQALRDAGIESVYVPHGIESVYAPSPSDIRRRLRVPDDAFLVMMNAANIGNTPPRKAWDQNLQALADLMRAHPDVYAYLHTDVRRPGGVPIDGIASLWGLPMDRLRVADQQAYRWGVISPEELARLYSAADVLLACSMGEGFGIPVVEAMACGTPAIVTDFSAQPELVGDTGWRCRYQMHYDQGQHAALAMPLVFSIREALEAAYEERGTAAAADRRDATRAKAREYDADTVYAEMWRPLLRSMADEIAPRQKPTINLAMKQPRKGKR